MPNDSCRQEGPRSCLWAERKGILLSADVAFQLFLVLCPQKVVYMGRCSGMVLIRNRGTVGKVIFMSAWSTAGPAGGVWNARRRESLGPLPPVYGGDQVLSLLLPTQCGSFLGGRKVNLAFLSTCRVDQIGLNATNTFLVYTEEDLGDLLRVKLTWNGVFQSWYNLWKELRSYLSQPSKSEQELNIRRIRVKSGETQRK